MVVSGCTKSPSASNKLPVHVLRRSMEMASRCIFSQSNDPDKMMDDIAEDSRLLATMGYAVEFQENNQQDIRLVVISNADGVVLVKQLTKGASDIVESKHMPSGDYHTANHRRLMEWFRN